MTTVKELYQGAERLINEILRQEMVDQGHHLTGAMEESLTSETKSTAKQDIMQGLAIGYTKFVDQGFPAKSASFKQVPFLIDFFVKRGFSLVARSGEFSAVAMAFATVQKWKKEGMPTRSSARFSKTGARTNMIANAFVGSASKIDNFMTDGFDFLVTEKFKKERDETI